MNEEVVGSNEINSELTGLNKGQKEQKKHLIIGMIASSIIIVALIIIIIILSLKGGDDDDDDKKKGDDDDDDKKKEIIGEINCIYDIKTISRPTMILGKEFSQNGDFAIYIDGKEIAYSKVHTFDTISYHNIQLKLFTELNMDNMFKDVLDLVSIEMVSNKSSNITSMVSTFENCENLRFFNISGFNVEYLTSMEKFFYKSSILEYYFNDFNPMQLEDISYMFSFTPILAFDSVLFNTESVKNMSHLFEECSSNSENKKKYIKNIFFGHQIK